MMLETRPLSFWSTVRLLLAVSRERASGRRERQTELLNTRKKGSTDWSVLGHFFAVVLMIFINGMAGWLVNVAVEAGQRVRAEQQGKIVVSRQFLEALRFAESKEDPTPDEDLSASGWYGIEADRVADHEGGDKKQIERKLRDTVRERGSAAFVRQSQVAPGVAGIANDRLAAMLGSVVLLWWMVMLAFQGEGLELDLQRRRHPMWEWLLSHPVKPGAVFLAEMLSPIVANPAYWGGPIFVAMVYGFAYDPGTAIIAAVVIGVPVTVALACLGKALEIGVTLRFAPRTRGAVVGLMSWAGYASMMLFFFGFFFVPKVVEALGSVLTVVAKLPWPFLLWFLGGRGDGTFSFPLGVIACWTGSVLTIAGAVWFSVWGAQQGLAGNFAADTAPPRRRESNVRFGKDPLYRKEFLWFVRDRSAVVQAILIPLTIAGFQLFNMRGVLNYAQGAWNYLCGAAILFGTYFLWILGPKSLTSEGTALWIALTWPRGLESLLKAKAWLWSLISSGLVTLVLLYAAYLFPGDILKIALVGVGWFLFARTMAEKSVTLVTVASQSGEAEQVPKGRRWAAQLGMLTFSIGVLTMQWQLAVIGIVYSYITSAAMWQNFRARLPYLYDPWSEELPPAPTLMHAMISISVLIEVSAVISGSLIGIAGKQNAAIAQAVGYAISALIVSAGVWRFLDDRDVKLRDVVRWPAASREAAALNADGSLGRFAMTLLIGGGAGVVLALFADGYMAVLRHIPDAAEILRKGEEQMSSVPNLRISLTVMAVAFAPFAEEYLFRGLLYRALDREWGGWRAVVGSAAFFAIYHPPLSWLPVATLGAANAILFKKTGRLAPCIVLHAVYNAVVSF